MEAEKRKPGSVRLTDEEYQEMETLGIENESAYVRYKLNKGRQHLQVLRDPALGQAADESDRLFPKTDSSPADQGYQLTAVSRAEGKSSLSDKLSIQKLEMENTRLLEKLDELERGRDQSLSGIHHQVEDLLKEELLKRDFEAAKKENQSLLKQVEKLEKEAEGLKKDLGCKDEEINELVKKLGLVELGKVLLPGAINGLAGRYPKEMQGLAAALGSLTGEEVERMLPSANGLSEEQKHLLHIAEYFRGLFNDEQFEQLVTMVGQLGEQVREDTAVISKVVYYLKQIARVRGAGEAKQSNNTIE